MNWLKPSAGVARTARLADHALRVRGVCEHAVIGRRSSRSTSKKWILKPVRFVFTSGRTHQLREPERGGGFACALSG